VPITEPTFSDYHHQQQQLNRYLFGFLREKEAEETLNLLYYPLKKEQNRYQASFCLLISDLFSGNKQQALRYAALIELVRAGVLVHDEVVDDDHVRDGMSSLWQFVKKNVASTSDKFNPKNLALLLGDSLLAKSLSLVDEVPAWRELGNFLNLMTEGAVSEQKRGPENEAGTSEKDYLDQVRLKQGSLFALAARLGYLTSTVIERGDKNAQLLEELAMDLSLIQDLGRQLASKKDSPINRQQQKKLVVNYTRQFVHKLKNLPRNRYRALLKQAPFSIVNQLLASEGKEFRLELK